MSKSNMPPSVVNSPYHKEMVEYAKLPADAREQLIKIDCLIATGLLSQKEVDRLRPVIISQAKKMMSATAAAAKVQLPSTKTSTNTASGVGKKNTTATNAGNANTSPLSSAMVKCPVCSIINTHDEIYCTVCSAKLSELNDQDPYASTYAEIKSANLPGTDPSTPLTLEDMINCDDAATLLTWYLNGGGKMPRALKPGDVRVRDMRSVCLIAMSRLHASLDADNPHVNQEHIPLAMKVLEQVDQALQLYTDYEKRKQ